MKSIIKMIPLFGVVMLLGVATAVAASNKKDDSEAGRILEAMQLYTEASSLENTDARRAELLSQSETILLDVVEKNPESLDAYRKLMGVYLQMRDYRQAVQAMQSAISLSPEDPKLYIALAVLYDHMGAYEYALPIVEHALQLDASNQIAREYRVSIQHKIDMQNLAMEPGTSPHEAGNPHAP